MTQRKVPTKSEVDAYLRDRRNWGRWGDRGSAGAINLITAGKRRSAAALVRSGRAVSLSRPLSITPSPDNIWPTQHYVVKIDQPPDGGGAADYYGFFYHGTAATHIDALCHTWNKDGMWDGHDPERVVKYSGATYGGIDEWSEGILTRGVLLDVPKHRDKPYVTLDEPVHGWELEDIAKEEGLTLEPGDAVMVYSGRETYARDHDGSYAARPERPGLHASCLPFIRDNDISILGWDMMDAMPNEYGIPWAVHGAIFAYGVPLLDNALLEPLAKACGGENTYEFMLTVNPLFVIGGTGSPVNPIAVF